MEAIELIKAERERQVSAERWTPEHDDSHAQGELATAAACYAFAGARDNYVADWINTMWPWAPHWWKPSPDNRIRELVKAGALIVAEIERIQRAGAAAPAPEHSTNQITNPSPTK